MDTAREFLAALDTFFCTADEYEAKRLWDILSAIRGPDTEDPNGEVKAQTTNHIRAAAFPKLRARWETSVKLGAWGTTPDREYQFYGFDMPVRASFYRIGEKPESSIEKLGSVHFRSHIRAAAVALGLH